MGALNELQYRANFFIQVLQSALSLAAGLVGLALVFGRTASLNGWTRPQPLALMGVFTMVGGIANTFIVPNMQRLVDDVQRGDARLRVDEAGWRPDTGERPAGVDLAQRRQNLPVDGGRGADDDGRFMVVGHAVHDRGEVGAEVGGGEGFRAGVGIRLRTFGKGLRDA